jgi:hypothetical protein
VNLTQAIAELKARGFDYLSDARATIMLNNAKNAFEDEFDWPWLETTTTGVAPLTISDLGAVLYVVDTTDGSELQGIDARDVVDVDTNVSTAGVPTSWWLDGTVSLGVDRLRRRGGVQGRRSLQRGAGAAQRRPPAPAAADHRRVFGAQPAGPELPDRHGRERGLVDDDVRVPLRRRG